MFYVQSTISKLRYTVPTLNLTLILSQSCGTDVARCSKRSNSLHRRAVKLILPDTTLTTDQKLKEMRILSLHKQLEYNKGLFMYRVLNSEAPEYISNLYTHTPSRHSNSRNCHFSLPRPRIDTLFKTSIAFSWCLSVNIPTSNSQILPFTQLLQAKTSCTP